MLEELLQKYLTGTSSDQERKQLIEWYNSFNDENVVVPVYAENDETEIYNRLRACIDVALRDNGSKEPQKHIHVFTYYRKIAAAIIILLGGSTLWWFHENHGTLKTATVTMQNKIADRNNDAILTLADGTKIILDSAANGQIGMQGNSKVIKQGTTVVYTNARQMADKIVQYNTMSTPKGKVFQIMLPDGTKVWLNAASSIRYPTFLNDSERNVSITGEAYFEVAHRENKTGKRVPFIVHTDRMSVKVLGTHFDVNAYADEQNYKATLFEGSVEVYGSNERNAVKIVPGQQASLFISDEKPKISAADLDKVMAWRNDMFQFDDDRLDDILKQVARWYDVEVVCAEDKRQLRFNGIISRRSDIDGILHLLSVTGVVNFKINGRTVYAY